jgi:hypothetical protein
MKMWIFPPGYTGIIGHLYRYGLTTSMGLPAAYPALFQIGDNFIGINAGLVLNYAVSGLGVLTIILSLYNETVRGMPLVNLCCLVLPYRLFSEVSRCIPHTPHNVPGRTLEREERDLRRQAHPLKARESVLR